MQKYLTSTLYVLIYYLASTWKYNYMYAQNYLPNILTTKFV